MRAKELCIALLICTVAFMGLTVYLTIKLRSANRRSLEVREVESQTEQMTTASRIETPKIIPKRDSPLAQLPWLISAEDIDRCAKRRGLKPVQITDECHIWLGKNPEIIRARWKITPQGLRLDELFVGNMDVDHGPEGQESVLAVWQELCPPMGVKFKARFNENFFVLAPLRRLGESHYGFAVGERNKAYINYIGPQSVSR